MKERGSESLCESARVGRGLERERVGVCFQIFEADPRAQELRCLLRSKRRLPSPAGAEGRAGALLVSAQTFLEWRASREGGASGVSVQLVVRDTQWGLVRGSPATVFLPSWPTKTPPLVFRSPLSSFSLGSAQSLCLVWRCEGESSLFMRGISVERATAAKAVGERRFSLQLVGSSLLLLFLLKASSFERNLCASGLRLALPVSSPESDKRRSCEDLQKRHAILLGAAPSPLTRRVLLRLLERDECDAEQPLFPLQWMATPSKRRETGGQALARRV